MELTNSQKLAINTELKYLEQSLNRFDHLLESYKSVEKAKNDYMNIFNTLLENYIALLLNETPPERAKVVLMLNLRKDLENYHLKSH